MEVEVKHVIKDVKKFNKFLKEKNLKKEKLKAQNIVVWRIKSY